MSYGPKVRVTLCLVVVSRGQLSTEVRENTLVNVLRTNSCQAFENVAIELPGDIRVHLFGAAGDHAVLHAMRMGTAIRDGSHAVLTLYALRVCIV